MGGAPIGKVPSKGYGVLRSIWNAFFKYQTSINDLKNNYALFRSIYYSTPLDGVKLHESMFMGSGFAKPIVNSTMAFALGSGFTIRVAGADENDALKAIEDDLEVVRTREFAKIYKWLTWGTRDGDGFIYVDESGNSTILKPETVDVVVDATSGDIVGYNVTELVTITDPTTGQKTNYTYLRQYRHSYVRVTRMEENQEQKDGEILYERIFVNGEDIDTQARDENGDPIKIEVFEDELDVRPLPIIHYRNEAEPGYLYGNSELQNVVIYMRAYGETLDEATKREVYNGKPVLAMHGVDDPTKDPKNKNATQTEQDGEKVLDWDQRSVLYFTDPQSKAAFLTIPATMENTGKLLEYIFYCIVQASETPEFVFGTAVSSSKSSVESQMPIVAQKAERKRTQMRDVLIEFFRLYISRQIENSNPTYFPMRGATPELDIDFPEVIGEDKTLVRETIAMFLENGTIGDEQALELSAIADQIEDKKTAVEQGRKDLAARNALNNVYPEEADRLTEELNSDDDALNNLDEA